ncbi:MAG: hypothetical protein HYR67_09005 [Bacteroidetes bacterium]|nr:hypothetical protein [Bacteroidota bacterium]
MPFQPKFYSLTKGFSTLVLITMTGICPAQNPVADSVTRILSSHLADSAKVQSLFELGRKSWFGRNLENASYVLRESIALAEKTKYFTHQADAYNLLANIYLKQEEFDSTFLSLQKAMDQNNKAFLPFIHETYSRLYYQLGDYPSAFHYAQLSAAGYEKSADPNIQLLCIYPYLLAGDVLIKLRQDEKAFEYYQAAYKKALTASENWYIKNPIQKMADHFLSKNKFEKAKHLYDTIILIDRDAPSHEPILYSYEGLGRVAMKQNEFKNAIRLFRQALTYARYQHLSIDEENLYTQLGAALLADKQIDSARYYLNQAISGSTRNKSYNNLSRSYFYLSSLQEQQKDFQNAMLSYQLHKSYEDSILSIEKIRAVNHLEVLYQTRHKEEEIVSLQKAHLEKDFEIRRRNIYISIAFGLVLALAAIVLLLRHNFQNKQRLQSERVKQMEQQQQVVSLQSMINGQETERARIAKDLHDGLGGLFSTVKMYFSSLKHDAPELNHNELFQKSFELVDTASLEVRRIAHNMMPEVLMKLGLVDAVKDLCDNISAGKLLKVSLEAHGMSKRLNDSTEIMLFRIVQELLNNVIKHAHATEAIIQFIKENSRLSVIVEDNGQGFNTKEADLLKHAGIATIQSRVNYLNGKMTIDSQKNVGTTVMMDFLIHEE